jgi:hypothetical protein
MYKIIGADQKEYGPVSSDQIRQWIRENRVNGNTQVCSEGAQEWQPLSALPEFAEALGTAPAAPAFPVTPASQPPDGRQPALQAVKGPAIALIATAVVNLVFGIWQCFRLAFFNDLDRYSRLPQFNDPQLQKLLHQLYGPVGIASCAFQLILSVLLLMGAVKMLALRNYGLALTAAILAVVPCLTPCCFIGIPFGIWALVILNKAEVKSEFS